MSPEEFRRLGHRFIDWISDYWERVDSLPVMSRVRPGEVMGMLPEHAPHDGMDAGAWDGVLEEIDRIIVPGLTNWQSPNFFAYFPANISGPAVLGELLSAGLGVQGMLWQTSPACTELEIRVLDWLGEAIGLPESFLSRSRGKGGSGGGTGGGVIQGTASEAALVAMIAARKRAVGAGAGASELVAYASEQAHSSILKAGIICGLCGDASDHERLRMVPVGPDFAMDVGELRRMMREDVAAGLRPFFVCASVGTTGSTAVDRVGEIAGVLEEVDQVDTGGTPVPRDGVGGKAWLHVDAAHAGAACVCPEFRWMIAGVERADSFNFNPHKWLLTNFDCNCFWTRDCKAIVDAMSVTPEYLRNAASESGEVVDYRDWQVPLGRRFRSLKLWLVMRHYGIEGLRAHVREHVRLAGVFEGFVRADERFELCAARGINLVCFRLRGQGAEGDARNRELMDRLNASGRLYLTHTSLPEWKEGARVAGRSRVVLRMAIGAVRTREEHVRAAWSAIAEEAGRV